MEQSSSNALRIVGIIAASFVVIVAALLLCLLSLCAFAMGSNSSDRTMFLMADVIDFLVLRRESSSS